MVPSTDWFLYGFVRKEAVITSQIEGTQTTLLDVVTFEATDRAERFEDVQEVCNYVDALTYARVQLTDPNGLPLSIRCCAIPWRWAHRSRFQSQNEAPAILAHQGRCLRHPDALPRP